MTLLWCRTPDTYDDDRHDLDDLDDLVLRYDPNDLDDLHDLDDLDDLLLPLST